VRSMPNGLPRSGDEGLDRTHTWGRTYWGGALFCLLADVEIRKTTKNRFGLRDAMSAVLRGSGGVSFEWPIERVLKTGDEATGTTVLQDLYSQMKDKPLSPDLNDLWKQLGIRQRGDGVELVDDAPLAATREAIMTP
jgi:predicted metalloprotease with PDZ domain